MTVDLSNVREWWEASGRPPCGESRTWGTPAVLYRTFTANHMLRHFMRPLVSLPVPEDTYTLKWDRGRVAGWPGFCLIPQKNELESEYGL